MAYTTDELSGAVEKLVRTAIRHDYDSLGVRKTSTCFGDLKDAASGMFIARDGAPFYVVLLARDRLVEYSTSLRETIATLDRYAVASSRTLSPVTHTRSLTNARVALDALAQATAQRTGTYQNIENIPAFLRFDRNSQKFLDQESQKLKYRGDLIETPEQARDLLRPGLRDLRLLYDELLRKTELIKDSIPNFQALDLPATLSLEVMNNASSVLQSRVTQLDEMTEKDRLKVLKDVTLDVLAARAAVKGFGSLQPPTLFVLLEGTGALFADETHPATPAALKAELDGGYPITEDAAFLYFQVDGAYDLQYPVPGSFVASLDYPGTWSSASSTTEREIFSGTNQFRYVQYIVGVTSTYNITLTPGLYSPAAFMTALNTQFGANLTHIECVLVFGIPKTTQEVDVAGAGPTGVVFTLGDLLDATTLGVAIGDYIFIGDESSSGYRSLYEVTGTTPFVPQTFPTPNTRSTITADRLVGSSSNGETILIEVGAAGTEYPRVRLREAYSNISGRADLTVEDVLVGSCANSGIASGSRARSSRTQASGIARDLSQSSATFVSAAARMDATSVFEPDENIGTTQIRTHPENATALTFYLYRGRAEVMVSGANAQFKLLDELPVPLDSTTKAVIVRSAVAPEDVDNHGEVTSVSGTDTLVMSMANPLVATVGDVVDIEYGWNYFLLHGQYRHDTIIEVSSDIEQKGRFTVVEKSFSSTTGQALPFEVLVDPGVSAYVLPGGQPNYFEGTVGADRVVFRSLSTGIDSKVVSSVPLVPVAPAHYRFFSSNPAEAVGTTIWVLLPELPARLEVGDQLELHLTSSITPDLVRVIDRIEPENLLIRLTEPIDVDYMPSISFTLDSPPPFARIRKRVKQNFDDMAELLSEWMSTTNALTTFRELDAALNSLLVNRNPSVSQVGTFRSRLDDLNSSLEDLEAALTTYSTGIVDEVDTLIDAFRAQGADRAVDILLEGDFQSFFNLDLQSSSYAGHVQKGLRDVQREDFPVRKDKRATFDNMAKQQIIAQFDDVDFERVVETADPLEKVEIPELNDVLLGLPVP